MTNVNFLFIREDRKTRDLERREEDCKWSYIFSMERKCHRIWALLAFISPPPAAFMSLCREIFLNNGTFSCFNQMQFCKQFL